MKSDKNKNLDKPYFERERNLVYFHTSIINKEHEKIAIPMIARPYSVLKMVECCKDSLKQDNNYSHKIYSETINIILQSRVNIHELCINIFKYICCSPEFAGILPDIIDEDIDVYCDLTFNYKETEIKASSTHTTLKFPGPYLEVIKSELSIPLLSRLGFLSIEEMSVIFGTAFTMMNEKVSIKEFTYTHLMSFLAKKENNEIDIKGIKNALDNLVFYGFITLPHIVSCKEDKTVEEGAIEISLCDLNKWYQGKRKGGGKIFD